MAMIENLSVLTEEDVKYRLITPALEKAGWQKEQIRMEYCFTDGRIISAGSEYERASKKKADYILQFNNDNMLAVVEAKSATKNLTTGLQQAIGYAEALDVPFAFAVNRTKEQESLISEHEQTIQGLQGKLYTEGRTIYTPEQQEILKKRISDFDFPVRIWICLRAAEILTVGDLVKHHRSDLLEFRNFGKKSIVELDKFLEAHGLSWGMEIE